MENQSLLNRCFNAMHISALLCLFGEGCLLSLSGSVAAFDHEYAYSVRDVC